MQTATVRKIPRVQKTRARVVENSAVVAVLKRAAFLISDKAHCRGATAKDILGRSVSHLSEDAESFSIEGAILRAYAEMTHEFKAPQYDGAPEEAHDAICEYLGTTRLSQWNDLAVSDKHVLGVLDTVAKRLSPVVIDTPNDGRGAP